MFTCNGLLPFPFIFAKYRTLIGGASFCLAAVILFIVLLLYLPTIIFQTN
ncbi:CBS domain protein [Bacillus cereus Rock3-42]|nr:CBS domain protein [Bacillus cereus Rock3-42]